MPIKDRSVFNKCGESSNFHRTFSGVQMRTPREMPRVSKEDKVAILGASAVGEYKRSSVKKKAELRGHLLFWREGKPIELFQTMFELIGSTDIIDFTPGTCAAACAALAKGLRYEGLCANEAYKNWCDSLMDNVAFATICMGKEAAAAVGATEDHVKKVAEYFAGTVQSAKRYLREKEGVVSEVASEERGSDVEDSGERWGLGVEEGSGEGRRSWEGKGAAGEEEAPWILNPAASILNPAMWILIPALWI